MMSQFEETMDSGAMELDADRIMKTNNNFGIEKKAKEINSGNDPGTKSFTMPLKQMSCGCSICGKTSQNGVGGICKGCWNQFQAKGVRIGNINEFEQFTEAVKNQVSRITIVDDNKTASGQEKLMENIRQIVPAIFSKSEAEPVSKRSLHVENEAIPKPGAITRSKTFAYLKPEETDKDFQKSTSPSKMKRATTGISLTKPATQSKALGSRKSTTAVPDRKTQRKELPPSQSSSTASYKEVYTPQTVDKSKFLAISLEQIEQRNRKMQLAANKSRLSKMRNKTSSKKKSYRNDPLNMMQSGKNALKRMACDRKRNSGSEDDDEEDDIDNNVPSLANQDKLLKRPQRSPRLRTEYTPRILDHEHGMRSQEERTQPRQRPNLEKYGLYNIENDKDREKQQSAEVHRKPQAVSYNTTNQQESAYYQTPAEAKSIRSAVSKSDYFMPTIQENKVQEEAAYFNQPSARATQSMPIKNKPNQSGSDVKKDVSDYMAYKRGYKTATPVSSAFSEAGDLTKKVESAFGTCDKTVTLKSIEGKGDNDLYTVAKDKIPEHGSNLYTIAKQFPVATPLAQDTYFEPYKGRELPTNAARPFRVGGSVNLMLTDGKVEQSRPLDKTDDCYTGGIGPRNAKQSSSLKEMYSNVAPSVVNNDNLVINSKSESIYADDGNFFKSKPYAIEESTYFDSEKTVTPVKPTIPEVPSAASDSDCYTGALFNAAQFRPGIVLKKDTPLAIENQSISDKLVPPRVHSPSPILEPTLPSSEHSVAPAADSQGSARMFSRKQRLNVDSILDNSVSSAGEFFSKAIMSFGNHNNHSNQSGGSDSEAICGTSCCGASFNEDQLDFGELARKMPAEYVDWPQGTRPNYGCFKENQPTSSPRAFDVNYKKYDNIEWQNNEEEAAAKAQWFNNTQDLATYGKQAALTWDGRPWSETVEERQFSQMMQMRSRSPFGARRAFVSPEKMSNVYEGGKVCRVCPNSNNSWTYSNEIEVGDVNNNYPNYEMYDRPAPPPQQQRMSAPAAPLPCQEDDYAPCIYAPPAAQEHLLARPRPEPPVRSAQRNYSSSYGQMGSPYASESPYFGSSGGSYGYMGYEEPPPPEVQAPREPSPPPVPKIYKVGEIRVRNNVENNDDYAENINRDLGHDESMGFPGGVQFNDLSAYGRAFAFPTSQVLEAPPVERHPPVERQHTKQETRDRSHKPRDQRERSFTNRETKETRKSSSYSHKTYDDTDNGRQWAQERKSLTDIRQKSEESRKRGSKTSDKKPRRSASQGREASYVHRPSAGGDYMRSVKPQPQPREERSFKPERKNHFKKDDKKKEEQPDTQRPGFFRKVARGLRLVN